MVRMITPEGIKLSKVSFSYMKGKAVLDDISLFIEKGGFLGITGVNGSGKSTFSYLLNGLIPHTIKGHLEGSITVDGTDTRKRDVPYFAGKIGMVFQNPDYSLFNLTVYEELEFGLKNLKYDNHKERIRNALAIVGMESFSARDPQSLSYGEKQKISLAMVLAMDTEYIVLDEPSAMLDYKSSIELYEILAELNNQGKTVLTIEHDTDFLWKYVSKTVIFDSGRIAHHGNTKDILSKENMLKKLGIKIPNYNYD